MTSCLLIEAHSLKHVARPHLLRIARGSRTISLEKHSMSRCTSLRTPGGANGAQIGCDAARFSPMPPDRLMRMTTPRRPVLAHASTIAALRHVYGRGRTFEIVCRRRRRNKLLHKLLSATDLPRRCLLQIFDGSRA
jgi:hypothetical protein